MGCIQPKSDESGVRILNDRGKISKICPQILERTKRLSTFTVSHQGFIKEKHTMVSDDYNIGDTIGKGGYGEVKRATHKKTGIVRAIKIVEKHLTRVEKIQRVMNEVSILRSLNHPNIMKITEFYQDDAHLYIVSEYYEGGELFEKVIGLNSFTEAAAARVMKQILSAVTYLHTNNIVHRDLKPENILYETKDLNSSIKIIDFGTAAIMDSQKPMTKAFGTAYYVAPEVLKKSYNEKCDIWSCGVMMYILLCGHPPFNGKSEKKILEKVVKGLYEFKDSEWRQVSEEAKELIKKMLNYDPNARISAREAMKDPWFDKVMVNAATDKPMVLNTLKNLRSFRAEQKLQQTIWMFLATYFAAKDEKQKMMEIFDKIDVNKDGILSQEELKQGIELLTGKKMGNTDVVQLIKNLDLDHDGHVDFSEFVSAAVNRRNLLSAEKLETVFKLFDKDGNGYLTVDEIKDFFSPSQQVEDIVWEDVINEVDTDGDGMVSLAEFKDMMLKLLK